MRTLQFGLRVADREASVAFSTTLGYEVVGQVPDSPVDHLTMLKLPDDEFVALGMIGEPFGSDSNSGIVVARGEVRLRRRSPAAKCGSAAYHHSNGEAGSPAPGMLTITITVVSGSIVYRLAPLAR